MFKCLTTTSNLLSSSIIYFMAYVTQPFTSLPLYKVKDAKGPIQRKALCMGPYAGVDYNLTSCPLQSRLQRIYVPWAIQCQNRP
jgi:hypothetical protein